MTELVVLDVGHGNSAILKSEGAVAVVDAPVGSLLLDTLRDMGVSMVDVAFVSHADKDHLAGIMTLLTSRDVKVKVLYLNADANRRSTLWRSFLAAVSVAEKEGGVDVRTSLSSTVPGVVSLGQATIRVVAPSASLTLAGAGGLTASDQPITANTLSGVLKVEVLDGKGVLLAGDMDEVGLDDALHHGADLRADVLVFPHHGGSPKGDPTIFTNRLIKAVGAERVIFSNGRNRYDNPQRAIVDAAVARGCAVSCTQLSKNCCGSPLDDRHLETVRAHGRKKGVSCAGSMTFELNFGADRQGQAVAAFEAFVTQHVPTPMCRPRTDIEHVAAEQPCH